MTTPDALFRHDFRQWKSAEDFRTHVWSYDSNIANWAKTIIMHHTYSPQEYQWRGLATMQGMMRYYCGLGWTSGPHLFIAPDGIWQMTAINEPGTHAAMWNNKSWGVEMVGYFDHHTWSEKQRTTMYHVAETLLRWRGLQPSKNTVLGHRETGSKKTCPGTMIDMNVVRADLRARFIQDTNP